MKMSKRVLPVYLVFVVRYVYRVKPIRRSTADISYLFISRKPLIPGYTGKTSKPQKPDKPDKPIRRCAACGASAHTQAN
jgi:hypothetical protein